MKVQSPNDSTVSKNLGAGLFSALMALGCSAPTHAEDNAEELAKKLSNPIASLISVPLQYNHDSGYGPDDGEKAYGKVQSVIPFSLSDDWNLISRTILPIVWQNDIAGPSGDQFGLGNITQCLFFSPKRPTDNGIIWGMGPVFLIPTGTDPLLSARKWGAGPTGVVLNQFDGRTVGMLANHIWPFAGNGDRPDISSTFMQPFISYTTRDAWTITLNTENRYKWEAESWSVPLNFTVSEIVKLNKLHVSLTAGVRYWADSQKNEPDGCGFRAGLTFLLP